MQPILLYYKNGNESAFALARRMAQWLERRGRESVLLKAGDNIEFMPSLAIAAGGDGTILGLARKLAGKNVPVLGINFGRIGFLTAAEPEDWQSAVEDALANRLPITRCMALHWRRMALGEILSEGIAVNDVVAARGSQARLLTFGISADHIPLGSFRSDGVILGTPLGSTGYAASAGGSILQNSLELINLVPICPFPAKIPPMVYEGKCSVDVFLADYAREWYLTIDGQEVYALDAGDVIRVTGIPEAIWLAGSAHRFSKRWLSAAAGE